MKLSTPNGDSLHIFKDDIESVTPSRIGQKPDTWDESGEITIPAEVHMKSGNTVAISDKSYEKLHAKGF